MVKSERHSAIREILATHRVGSQEHLRELLAERGLEVAQATLSRDIRELRLGKIPDAEGRVSYQLPPAGSESRPPLERLIPALYVGAEGSGNLVLVKTLAGGAQAIAEALDWEEWPEVLGTLGGDDTILVVLRDPGARESVIARLEALAGEH